MVFSGINYLAVLVAAVVGFAAGSVWYGVFGKPWAMAQGKEPGSFRPKPGPFVLAFAAQVLMAFVLAGLIGHLGDVDLQSGIVTGALVWLGFVATTIVVNDAFQGASVSLTLIDAGHWLVVLVLMGAAIGLIGL